MALHKTMDSICSQLHFSGIGNFAAVITHADKDLLWERKIMDFNTPKGLFCSLFCSMLTLNY